MSDEFWKALPSILWVVLVAVGLFAFHSEIRSVAQQLAWRIKAGAAFKLVSFEIGSTYISPGEIHTRPSGLAEIRDDSTLEFHKAREPFRSTCRNLFLVHRLAPARDNAQLYDILIYLVPSIKYGCLEGVLAVEYYFGRHWGSRIFKSIDRASGFSIATSAWAPFSCTAKVQFTDGQSVFLHRYIDFEMGPVGKTPFSNG